MKQTKNIQFSLAVLALLAVGLGSCQKTPDSAASSVASSEAPVSSVAPASSSAAVYDTSLKLKASATEIELGYTTTVKAIVTTDGDDKTANFTVDDPTILEMPEAVNGVGSVKVTGKKIGTATITAAAVSNPSVTKTVKITVIALKPTLREAIAGIGALKNYTFTGAAMSGSAEVPSTITKVTENAIVTVDSAGGNLIDNGASTNALPRYGEAISNSTDGRAVYLDKATAGYVTTDAELVKSSKGFLTKDDFLGMGTDTMTPNDVGFFYSIAAINPNWVTDVKAEDNTYAIVGDATNEDSAFVESMLWQLIDFASYKKEVASLTEALFSTIAGAIDTSIVVNGVNDITVTLTDADANIYTGKISDVGTTNFDDNADLKAAIAAVTGKAPTLTSDLQKGREALMTNNYVQANIVYPDHKTSYTFYSYFTENYVFYYYDDTFVANYNNVTTVGKLDKSSGGFVKKADGIYAFSVTNPKYDEAGTTITTAATATLGAKVDGTDASTSLPTQVGYLGATKTITTDLIYSFTDTTATIFSGNSTKFHSTSSVPVFNEIGNYYAPEDYKDNKYFHFEKVQTGIAVGLNTDNSVSTVTFTIGSYPFINDDGTSGENWGVNNFSVSDFGKGGENVAKDAIAALLA
jgi:hypothetical protein